MKKAVRALVLSAVFAVFFATAVTGTAHAATSMQSVAFPMYGYPGIGTLWNDIYAAGSQVPFIIANPANGPGVGTGFDYTQYTTYLNNKPVTQRAIGYVYTNYHSRAIADVLKDADDWYTLYPQVSGIFVDLVQNGGAAADVCYDATVYNYIKGKHPQALVVMNPGANIEAAYEPYGDIFANAENTYTNYSSWTPLADGFENNPANASRFWHIVHTTSSGQMASALAQTRTNNAGWVLITDETMPNPYTTVPSYWSTFLTSVSSLPQTSIPNRGLTALPAGCIDLSLATTTSTSVQATQATNMLTNTVKNTDTTRTSWGITKMTYDVPVGATLTGLSGVGWDCTIAGASCGFAGNLTPNTSLPPITATFATDCNFSGGTVTATLQNFANNKALAGMVLAKPSGCSIATTSVGSGGVAAASKAKSTPATTETPTVSTTTQPTVTTAPTETPTTTPQQTAPVTQQQEVTEPEVAAPTATTNIVPYVVGGGIAVVIIAGGLIWWLLARHRQTLGGY